MSLTDKWHHEGLKQGLQEGLQQGWLEGEISGIQKGREQGLEQGQIAGERAAKLAIARNLLAENMAIEHIAKITDLSLSELRQLEAAAEETEVLS